MLTLCWFINVNAYSKSNEFLNQILKRPINEKPFVLLVVGKPKDDCEIPVYAEKKKTFSKITSIF